MTIRKADDGHYRPDANGHAPTEVSKRSIVVAGHKTSVSLESDFWFSLKELAAEEKKTLSALVEQIDAERGRRNLSSQLRLYVLRAQRIAAGKPASPPVIDGRVGVHAAVA